MKNPLFKAGVGRYGDDPKTKAIARRAAQLARSILGQWATRWLEKKNGK